MRGAVHGRHRIDLLVGETIWSVRAFAKEFVRPESTCLRIGQERVALRAAVLTPALLDNRVSDERELLGRNDNTEVGRAVVLDELPEKAGVKMGSVVARVARDNSVEVVRIALCFGERLLASGRATPEIDVARRLAVEGRDHRLRGVDRNVDRTACPIDDRLGVAGCEVWIVALMAGVCRDYRGCLSRLPRKHA